MSNITSSKTLSAARKVTITLARNDLEPPIFIIGPFTTTPWEPEEMEVSATQDGDVKSKFYKTFDMVPGTYQYKFRLGRGDWWICDEQSTIVYDEAGNSNNQLIVPEISISESPSHTDPPSINLTESIKPIDLKVTGSSPQIPIISNNEDMGEPGDEDFLGTWEPGQELSPMHRRASTSLGIRIGRIGTFLPPASTAEESKNSRSEIDALSGNELSRKELSDDDDDLETMEDIDQCPPTGTAEIDSSEGKGHQPSPISNLDRILEVNPAVLRVSPILSNPSTPFGILPEHNKTYGSISTSSSTTATNGQLSERHIPRTESVEPRPAQPASSEPTTANGDLTGDRKASNTSMDSVAEHKAEAAAGKEELKGFLFFAMLAGWISFVWTWFFAKPKRAEQ